MLQTLGPTAEAAAALLVVATMFAMFVRESYPPEVVALAGASAMFVLGMLPYHSALEVLANPAPWTIMAMFLVMGGLVRTGALRWLTAQAERGVDRRPVLTIVGTLLLVALASAFMNNTPVVVVMIPIFIQLAQKLGQPPSKLLIPLSYAAILGGTLTLLGTSTNLLVDGVARSEGLDPFTIFEIAPLGMVQIVVGLSYLALVGRHLLPERQSLGVTLSDRRKLKYFTEVAVPEGSGLIGQSPLEADILRRDGVRVVDVLRGDASLRRDLRGVRLKTGDRIVLRSEMSELLGLQQDRNVRAVEKLSSVATETVEVLITPGCRMIGRSLGSMRLRRRYGVYPIAVHRRNQNIGRQLDDVVVRTGDTLLLEGASEDIQRLAIDMDLVNIARPAGQAYRRGKTPVAVAALALLVMLAWLGVAPILPLAVIAATVILLARCIDAEEAFSFIDGRLLALIFGMLAVGVGLQESGAVTLIVEAIVPFLSQIPPVAVIFCVYVLSSTFTETVSNNAVGVILTPIAIELGLALGLDPRPLVVAVMFAASAAFSTPIGYQTNMMVYGPGGYKFTDFMRVGVPLNLLLAVSASLTIPMIWPP